jgi:hypothetical protein
LQVKAIEVEKYQNHPDDVIRLQKVHCSVKLVRGVVLAVFFHLGTEPDTQCDRHDESHCVEEANFVSKSEKCENSVKILEEFLLSHKAIFFTEFLETNSVLVLRA